MSAHWIKSEVFLEEAGNGLSGGEKQRLVLARAFLKDSRFYILDESTGSLDFITENSIFDMIYNTCRDRSMLIIAHRLATVKSCDNIIGLSEGKIAEQGTHEELLAIRGEYYRLWEMHQGNIAVRAERKTDALSADEVDADEISY